MLFWAPLLFGGPLQGHDWSTHHFHYFDWVGIAFREYGSLPLYMADAWVTPNFIANAEAPTLGPLAWLLFALPTSAYVKLLIVLHTGAGLAGVFLLLRDLRVSAQVACLAAAGFAFGGFFSAHLGVGHHWAMGAYLLPLLLWLFRRAALGSDAALVAAALLDAFAILGGQHQPFIWQNLFLVGFAALWTLRVRAAFPLARLALLLALAAGLGALKLLPLWSEFSGYAPTARIQGIPLAALPAVLASRGAGPETLDPRILFEHGAGWWEYTFYLGAPALLLLALGCVAGRRGWPLLVLGAFFALLAVESSGVWPLLVDLPVWRSQRAPSRFLVLALFACWIVAALGLDRLRERLGKRFGRSALAAGWLLVALVSADLWWAALPWQRAATGAAIETREHRPQPLRVAAPGVRAELASFTPNRMIYRVVAEAPAKLVLPLRYGRHGAEWDAGELRPLEVGGMLALELPAGEREVVLEYRPPGLRAGAAVSALSLVAALLLASGWRPRVGEDAT